MHKSGLRDDPVQKGDKMKLSSIQEVESDMESEGTKKQ